MMVCKGKAKKPIRRWVLIERIRYLLERDECLRTTCNVGSRHCGLSRFQSFDKCFLVLECLELQNLRANGSRKDDVCRSFSGSPCHLNIGLSSGLGDLKLLLQGGLLCFHFTFNGSFNLIGKPRTMQNRTPQAPTNRLSLY